MARIRQTYCHPPRTLRIGQMSRVAEQRSSGHDRRGQGVNGAIGPIGFQARAGGERCRWLAGRTARRSDPPVEGRNAPIQSLLEQLTRTYAHIINELSLQNRALRDQPASQPTTVTPLTPPTPRRALTRDQQSGPVRETSPGGTALVTCTTQPTPTDSHSGPVVGPPLPTAGWVGPGFRPGGRRAEGRGRGDRGPAGAAAGRRRGDRRLLIYARQFNRPAPYRLAELAAAAEMSVSEVGTACTDRDIALVARKVKIHPPHGCPADPATPAARAATCGRRWSGSAGASVVGG
jgi:hypothetical protein